MSISIVRLSQGVENRILNCFKESRGRRFSTPIELTTEQGARYISAVSSAHWLGPGCLVIEATLLTSPSQKIGGEIARVELELDSRKRHGEIEVRELVR